MTENRDIKADRGGVAAGSITDSMITIINNNGVPLSKEGAEQLERQYLRRMMQDCAGLEWLRLMRKQDEDVDGFGLDSVYTALLTQSVEGEVFERLREFQPERPEQHRLSALACFNRAEYLVLLGDPGSGKSAFVNYLALCMAGEKLGDTNANLSLLTDPLPDKNGEPQTRKVEVDGKESTKGIRQPWDHGALIPLRIILRDFSASEYFPTKDDQADVCHLMDFISADLKSDDCLEYLPVLKARLRDEQRSVLVMFDGLDEVPQAGERRKRLLDCIEGFRRSYPNCRILVTCRPYAYQDKQWQLKGCAETRLAEFGQGQIIRFIRRWYGNSPDFDAQTAEQRADKLQQAILSRDSLSELAKRPLLLSLIAYLHANRHELPERRADLYERLLDLLIDEWEKARFKAGDVEAAWERDQYSLAEFLQVGQDTIRLVLERLAFKAHARQGAKQQGTADIAANDLIFELSMAAREAGKKIDVHDLCEYLRDRVGILYQRGGATERDAVYTFPHRSFQEYLAAAYFRRDEDGLFAQFEDADFELDDEVWQELAAQLGRHDPDRWREVIILAGGIKALKEPQPVWDLLEALTQDRDVELLQPQSAWGLRLASEILAESLKRDKLNRRQRRIFEGIQDALPGVLGTDCLAASERVAMGRYLAQIGDPRPEVNSVDAMRFCYVPAGPFYMGRGGHDKENEEWFGGMRAPASNYDVGYVYWLAQHPVTVAQFYQFVEEAEYEKYHKRSVQGDRNTPVVYVLQRDALAFCQWLTAKWHDEGVLPESYQITLPDETEWEKASRGGYEIDQSPAVSALAGCFSTGWDDNIVYQDNPEPQRRYPWGDKVDEEKLNFAMNIGTVSATGIYPEGMSPYGWHDMAGNVWEWTRSGRADYPYPALGAKEWKQRKCANNNVVVLRGGSFDHDRDDVRCAFRDLYGPDHCRDNLGFRVVLSPLR